MSPVASLTVPLQLQTCGFRTRLLGDVEILDHRVQLMFFACYLSNVQPDVAHVLGVHGVHVKR